MYRPTPSHIRELEAESIYVLREAAAQFERPVLLFSGGKDSIVMIHLAARAFRPARIPFPLVNIDTGHNFPEALQFRDALSSRLGVALHVGSVQDSIDAGRVKVDPDNPASRERQQIVTLLDTLEELGADCAVAGARRDEERVRAKERLFSHRNRFGYWDPETQRPSLWDLYNGHLRRVEHFRVYPIFDWSELDVWQYIAAEGIEVPSLYFSQRRQVVRRNGNLLARSASTRLVDGERWERVPVRFRTIGDPTCASVVESSASTVAEVVEETASTDLKQWEERIEDHYPECAMEDRKRRGYY